MSKERSLGRQAISNTQFQTIFQLTDYELLFYNEMVGKEVEDKIFFAMVAMIDKSEKRLSIIILVFIIKSIKRQKGQPDFDDIDDKCANLLSKCDME